MEFYVKGDHVIGEPYVPLFVGAFKIPNRIILLYNHQNLQKLQLFLVFFQVESIHTLEAKPMNQITIFPSLIFLYFEH